MLNIYCLTLFTDFVGDPETRSTCGYGFIGLIALYVLVHVAIIVKVTFCTLKGPLKKCYNRRKARKHQANNEASTKG